MESNEKKEVYDKGKRVEGKDSKHKKKARGCEENKRKTQTNNKDGDK